MLYLFHGSDVEKVRAKAFEWVAKAKGKEPNLAYLRLSREEISPSVLEDAAHSGGLFVKRLLVLIDDPFPTRIGDGEDSGAKTVLEDHIEELADSENAIVIVAPKLLAAKARKIAAKSKMVYSFDKPSREEARGFNTGLVNALGGRSREKLWVEINRALRAGDAPEMLHGLLHWKARDLMEKGGRGWTDEEARKLSLLLIELLQDSRRGGLDLSESLERFALSI
jgi:hypothetical protein